MGVVAVPKAWPGETVVVIATGPSLEAVCRDGVWSSDDVDYCRGRARVIAVNDAYLLAPWADALYACDARWWRWHHGAPTFAGAKWSLNHNAWVNYRAAFPDVGRLENTGPNGLEHRPTGLKSGRNSGYQAVNLAVHYGARRILLLGFDQCTTNGKAHFFGDHPNKARSPYPQFRQNFESLKKPLAKLGIEILNCSKHTALVTFPRVSLRVALPSLDERAIA